MKKTIAIAALLAASFAAPSLPVQAASDYPLDCLILPLLKADCRAAISGTVESGTTTVAEVTVATAEVASDTASSVAWPVPLWWNCTRAAAGAGHLYDCE